ncbi:unnamed protein product [Dibothriocephalus latus]|uniref:DAAF9 N-terminal domain-containing protein n=1 Tax=Dibothriocephalus latus TaxID=60516 RepID=A0A3P7KYP3_DIBLA|nr:unnamed protein product [Dibothriocephalus latus]
MEAIYCFCTNENIQQYVKNIFILPDVIVFRSDSDDPDKCEDMKVQAFKMMVDKCQKIAIPYSSGISGDDFEKSKLECWPLIQSFACNINDTAVIDTYKAICLGLSNLVENLEQYSFQYVKTAIEKAKKMIARNLSSVTYQKINLE